MNVLITGGTGLVGKALTKLLRENRYNVAVLSRRPKISGIKSFVYDYNSNYIDPEAIEFADVIINLACENIAARKWTKVQKNLILNSRVQTGEFLVDQISKSNKKPIKLISASAIGVCKTNI